MALHDGTKRNYVLRSREQIRSELEDFANQTAPAPESEFIALRWLAGVVWNIFWAQGDIITGLSQAVELVVDMAREIDDQGRRISELEAKLDSLNPRKR